ncbi:hypothetical protein JJC00_26855 [Bradyrhizobium diazoefficiens]|nr:hypothetical protein JJC00_26855 [Bradyrhizobium diazoefficiens]
MLAVALEKIKDFAPLKRAAYVRVILAGFAAIVLSKAFRFFAHGFWEAGQTTDFAAFYIAAHRVWLGDVDLTYQFQWFMKMQAQASAGREVMPMRAPRCFGSAAIVSMVLLPVPYYHVVFKRRRAATRSIADYLQLVEADMAGMGVTPCRAMAAEDIQGACNCCQQV